MTEQAKKERNEYMKNYFKKPENKERHKRAVYKSHAKRFVMQFATEEEMKELMNIRYGRYIY